MTPTILLVDDDAAFIESLRDGLQQGRPDFRVLLACDVEAAIQTIDRETVDLVVTDLKMPGKSGFDLLAHLMELHPDMPSLVMTAFATEDAQREARELGAIRLLAKPIDLGDVRRQVGRALALAKSGSSVHGVSPAGILQLLALERSTCLVTVCYAGEKAELAFVDGQLRQARNGAHTGEQVIYELLTWPTPKIATGKLREHPEPSIQMGLQELILEAARLQDEHSHTKALTAGKARKGGAAVDANQPATEQAPQRRPGSKKTTVKQRGAHVSPKLRKEQTMPVETYLDDLKGINGYLAAGIMNFTGELLASDSADAKIDLALVGATFNDIFRSAHEASCKIGLDACQETVISTPQGNIIMRCSGVDSKAHIHVIAVMKADGNRALMQMQMEKLVPKVVDELK